MMITKEGVEFLFKHRLLNSEKILIIQHYTALRHPFNFYMQVLLILGFLLSQQSIQNTAFLLLIFLLQRFEPTL